MYVVLAGRQRLVDVSARCSFVDAIFVTICCRYGEIRDAHLLLPYNEAFTPGDMPPVPPPQPLIYDRNTEQAKYIM